MGEGKAWSNVSSPPSDTRCDTRQVCGDPDLSPAVDILQAHLESSIDGGALLGCSVDGFDAAVGLATARATRGEKASARAVRHARDRVERALRLLASPAGGGEQPAPQDCVTLLDRATGHALLGDDDGALQLVEAAARPLGRRPYYGAAVRLDTIADILPATRLGELQAIERSYLRAA